MCQSPFHGASCFPFYRRTKSGGYSGGKGAEREREEGFQGRRVLLLLHAGPADPVDVNRDSSMSGPCSSLAPCAGVIYQSWRSTLSWRTSWCTDASVSVRTRVRQNSTGTPDTGSVHLSYNPYFSACFSARTVFFSHNKSAGIVFWLVFSAKRTGPDCFLCESAGMARHGHGLHRGVLASFLVLEF